jgi:hypothetical protein
MADDDDSLPAETSSFIEDVVSAVDGLPLPPAVKRSFWKAVGRLMGSIPDLGTKLIEHVTARIEAKTDAVRATTQARRIVKLEMVVKVADMIAADEAFARRAVAYLGHEMIAEQANRERVLGHAVADLRSAPPQEDPGREIDDDWLHAFMKEASIKSAPEMQLLFGKILSGEIKRPGTFSPKAVSTLGLMNQTTAQQFEQLCYMSISIESGVVKVVAYSGDAGQNSLAKHKLDFTALNDLNENCLVYSDFNSWHNLKSLAQFGEPFEYANDTVWLQTKDVTKLDGLSKVHGVTFSRVGAELKQIVSARPDPSYTSELIKYFEDRGCALIKATGRKEDGHLVGRPYRDLAGAA